MRLDHLLSKENEDMIKACQYNKESHRFDWIKRRLFNFERTSKEEKLSNDL